MNLAPSLYTYEADFTKAPAFTTGHAPIDQLHLDRMIAKAIHPLSEINWTLDEAIEISELYRVFLFLCYQYPERTIVPPREVDEFWHLHILDTRQYHIDCELIFGGYLHHFPYAGLQPDAEIKMLEQAAVNDTFELVRKHFPNVLGD